MTPAFPSFSQLQSTLEEKNVEEAFRAAHTLKGVAQNLGFTPLYEATATLTEVLRAGNLPEDDNMVYDFACTAAVQAVCIGVVRPGGRLAVLMPALLHKNT